MKLNRNSLDREGGESTLVRETNVGKSTESWMHMSYIPGDLSFLLMSKEQGIVQFAWRVGRGRVAGRNMVANLG